jgi:hypothetical protein
MGIRKGRQRKAYLCILMPILPEHYGDVTISHIMKAENAEEDGKLIDEWAENVWKAYAGSHKLAHEWLGKARNHYYK